MNIKKLLGNRIKELRLKHSLTQEALAEKINISAKSLSQIELGNNFISAATLESLCAAFDITPEILFDFNKYEPAQEDIVPKIIKKLEKNTHLSNLIYKIISIIDN